MTAAGWIWRCAKRVTTRRISCTDQQINGGSCGSSSGCFLGGRAYWPSADGGEHRKRQHDERDVPVPAVPGAGLVVVEAQLVFGRLEAVLDGPAPPLDRHLGFHSGPGGAPGGEEGQLAISDIAADQKAPGPKRQARSAV